MDHRKYMQFVRYVVLTGAFQPVALCDAHLWAQRKSALLISFRLAQFNPGVLPVPYRITVGGVILPLASLVVGCRC